MLSSIMRKNDTHPREAQATHTHTHAHAHTRKIYREFVPHDIHTLE